MSDKKKTSIAAPVASGSRRTATIAPGILETHPIFYEAIESFIRGNCNFESSVPINNALTEISAMGDLQLIFTSPIQRMLFTMDAALHWVLFFMAGPARAVEEGDPQMTSSFDPIIALKLITEVYDIGVQEAVWEHFEPDDDDDDDEEDEDEPEDE